MGMRTGGMGMQAEGMGVCAGVVRRGLAAASHSSDVAPPFHLSHAGMLHTWLMMRCHPPAWHAPPLTHGTGPTIAPQTP